MPSNAPNVRPSGRCDASLRDAFVLHAQRTHVWSGYNGLKPRCARIAQYDADENRVREVDLTDEKSQSSQSRDPRPNLKNSIFWMKSTPFDRNFCQESENHNFPDWIVREGVEPETSLGGPHWTNAPLENRANVVWVDKKFGLNFRTDRSEESFNPDRQSGFLSILVRIFVYALRKQLYSVQFSFRSFW